MNSNKYEVDSNGWTVLRQPVDNDREKKTMLPVTQSDVNLAFKKLNDLEKAFNVHGMRDASLALKIGNGQNFLGEKPCAVAWYKTAYDLKPSAQTAILLGNTLLDLKLYEPSEDWFEQADADLNAGKHGQNNQSEKQLRGQINKKLSIVRPLRQNDGLYRSGGDSVGYVNNKGIFL